MSAGERAALAKKAMEAGAVSLSGEMEATPGPLLDKLLSSMSESGSGAGSGRSVQKSVHLIRNLQPLPRKLVDAIQDGDFVDFAWFPVLEEGPLEGDWKESPRETGDGGPRKRREWKEVPDLSKWSTCFSLFQVAWASHKPEMWLPLTAYREIVFKLARRHPWAQVVKYDRRFRQEAAGREDVRWDEEKVHLVVDLMCSAPQSKGEGKSSAGGHGPGTGGNVGPRRVGGPRRSGVCFKFNKGQCGYGQTCKFTHVCSACGGDHPLNRCSNGDCKKTA